MADKEKADKPAKAAKPPKDKAQDKAQDKAPKPDKAAKPQKADKAEAGQAKEAKGAKAPKKPEAAAAPEEPRGPARLRKYYDDVVRKKMTEQFGYKNPMQVPGLDKVVINMGIGEGVNDRKKVRFAKRSGVEIDG